jgi:signal transduction histidine kinase
MAGARTGYQQRHDRKIVVTSLRARLFGVWVLSLGASVVVGVLLIQLYQLSSTSLVQRAEDELARACDRIADRTSYYLAGWTGPVPAPDDSRFQRDLDQAAALALAPTAGLSGGILREPADIMPATAASTVAATALAASSGVSIYARPAGSHTNLIYACRLPGPIPDLAGWVSTDVEAASGYSELRIGVGVLLALMLILSGGLTWLVTSWARQIRRIEVALARHDEVGLPPIAPTGEVELDRIAAALNNARARLLAAQGEAAASSARAARAERMASLGRVAAGVAHEIRNPIAAMRLRAESALALDPQAEPDRAATRGRAALGAILVQVERLDRLSGELLTMTQRRIPVPETVSLRAFLTGIATEFPDARLSIEAEDATVRFDPEMIRRAVDNLIQNAARHAPDRTGIILRGYLRPGGVRIEVEDSGPGIAPAVRETLFEPFVTSRADGTGLGLAIAREMVQAHGGQITLARAEPGALFAIELPQGDQT